MPKPRKKASKGKSRTPARATRKKTAKETNDKFRAHMREKRKEPVKGGTP